MSKLRMRIRYLPNRDADFRYLVQYRYQWFADWYTPWIGEDINRRHCRAAGLNQKQIEARFGPDAPYEGNRSYFATEKAAIGFARSFYDTQLLFDVLTAKRERARKAELKRLGKARTVWTWP